MKTNKKNTIDLLNCLPFKNTTNFEKNVIKKLPEGKYKIVLNSVGMEKIQRGSYNYFLDIYVNNEIITLRSYTNDSTAFDYYKEIEGKKLDDFLKQTTIMLIEECNYEIIECI